MAEYIVVAASLGVPTGKENPLTRLPQIAKFRRGQVVDSSKFDTEVGRDKIERLLAQGALRDPQDIPQQARAAYASDFDIPLDRDPGGAARAEEAGAVVKLPGDDIDDAGDDDSDNGAEAPVFKFTSQPADSLVDGTPEARLQGEAITSEQSEDEGTSETPSEAVETPLPEPPSRSASTAIWQQYAQRARLDVAPDASRSEIQEAYDRHVAEKS